MPLQEGKMTESSKHMCEMCMCSCICMCLCVWRPEDNLGCRSSEGRDQGLKARRAGPRCETVSFSGCQLGTDCRARVGGRQPCGLVILCSHSCPAPGPLSSVALSEGVTPSPGVLCALELLCRGVVETPRRQWALTRPHSSRLSQATDLTVPTPKKALPLARGGRPRVPGLPRFPSHRCGCTS